MHNHHFKPPVVQLGSRPRTPSPPRAFVEPLSPIKVTGHESSYPSTLGHSQQDSAHILNTARSAAAHSGATSNGHRHGHRRASSSIDELADAALANDFAFAAPQKKSSAVEGQRWALGYSRPANVCQTVGESPHKRAKSEHVPAVPTDRSLSRPATSYDQAGGRRHGQFGAPPSYESRVEEAALLLNFRTGGWPSAVMSPPMPPAPTAPPIRPHANSFPQDAHRQRLAEPFTSSTALPAGPSQTSPVPQPAPSILSPPSLTGSNVHKEYNLVGNSCEDITMTDASFLRSGPEAYSVEYAVPNSHKEIEMSGQTPDGATDGLGLPVKVQRGLTKSKARGPSVRRSLNDKLVQKRATKRSGDGSKVKKRSRKHPDDTVSLSDDEQVKPRRHSFHGISCVEDQPAPATRSHSVPREVSMVIVPLPDERVRQRKNAVEVDTVCAACNTLREAKSRNDELDEWISCNGCKGWFHIDCAGFKKAHEIRDVDKFFCPSCEQTHGKTTYVRKSGRAHAAVDYAELQKGVLKMSEESVEHHYIQPIKDGTFQFDAETFPRIRPEMITREFLETSSAFIEPICIPAEWNPRPWDEKHRRNSAHGTVDNVPTPTDDPLAGQLPDDFEYDMVSDDGQDRLGMVMPEGLTVRQVCNLVGAETPLDVIDVKTQNSGAKWNLSRWADYYEEDGEDKVIRNVISLEVSQSKLGRLLKRPQVVRDIDLQDDVWPQEEIDRGKWPKVQFYCLMSVADSYTDFHIDFGGSSVYYHILKGSKTFFFIPPKPKHLKAYEEWNESPQQNYTFLPHVTKECYRVDLHEGDTMLIPSGWIHAVWTPSTSLVIGGNFLTRMSYKNQFRVVEIEKNNETPMKFRYPFFQKIMWYTALKYLREDPLPPSVSQDFFAGHQFARATPLYEDYDGSVAAADPRPGAQNARYYSRAELDGLPELVNFIFRTVMVVMGRVEGTTTDRMRRVNASIPKGHGEPLDIAKTFALWVAWKRGNEDPPAWAHPNAVLPNKDEGPPKKLSARALKELERKEAIAAWRVAPDRQSNRVMNRNAAAVAANSAAAAVAAAPTGPAGTARDAEHIANNLPRSSATASASGFSNTSANHQPPSSPWPARDDMAAQTYLHARDGSSAHAARNGAPDVSGQSPHNHHQLTSAAAAASGLPTLSMNPMMPGQHLSTPKTSVLGPKRVACDVCRRRRIRCKHKDLVQQLDATPYSGMHVDSASGTPLGTPDVHDNITVSPSTGRDTNAPYGNAGMNGFQQYGDRPPLPGTNAYVNANIPMTMNGVAIFGETPRRGRTKACDECRKSKRRCVHDENGNVDPVKAREAPVPRGSLGAKKRESSDNNLTPQPRMSSQPFSPAENGLSTHVYQPQSQPFSGAVSRAHSSSTTNNSHNPAIDPNLFAMYTESGETNGYAHPAYSFPSENGHNYEYPSLEQIANEVLDMNGHSHGLAGESLEAAAPMRESSNGFLSHAHPPIAAESVDSGVSLAEPITPEQDREIPNVDPELEGGQLPLHANAGTTKPANGIPLYQPPAPLSPTSPKTGAGEMNGFLKRKRVSFSTSPETIKKNKTSGTSPPSLLDPAITSEVAHESEDERLARALQQEALGLRRRSK